MRTTSSLESFNAVLNKNIAKRTGFFKFIPCLRFLESRKADRMIQMANGIFRADQFKRKRERDQYRQAKIEVLTAKHLNGKVTKKNIKDFLGEMSEDMNGKI